MTELTLVGLKTGLATTRWQDLRLVAETGSTNADLAEELRVGRAGSGTALVALSQSAGQGREKRSWVSPPGTSVALSAVVVPPDGAIITLLPLLAGVAVAEAAADLGVTATLKWPNDVLCEGKKWCGILAQAIFEPQRVAIAGIGINVSQTEAELPVPTATSLALAGSRAGRGEVVLAVLRQLDLVLADWESGSDVLEHYRRLCTTLGQTVSLQLASRQVIGEVVAIDTEGRLGIAGADGLNYYAAGDVVHLRPAEVGQVR